MSAKKSYTNAFKLRLLEESKSVGKNQVAKKYNLPRRNLNNWYDVIDKLKETPRSQRARRAIHKQRQGKHHELEEMLYQWICAERLAHRIVDGASLKLQALKTAAQRIVDFPLSHNVTGFGTNNGWLGRFCKRFSLVRHRVTTSGRELPAETKDSLLLYIAETRGIAQRRALGSIVNMDETTFYLDMFGKCVHAFSSL